MDPIWILDPELIEDPAPIYRQLRETEPVHWNPVTETMTLSRYKDVVWALGDARFSVANLPQRLPPEALEDYCALVNTVADWPLFLDPPRHTHLRSLIVRAFTPGVVRRQEVRVHERVDDLLTAALLRPLEKGDKHLELIGDLALPLTTATLGDMLGFQAPLTDLVRWTTDLATYIGKAGITAEDLEAGARSLNEIDAQVRDVAAARSLAPQDDLISALVSDRDASSSPTHAELVALSSMLLFGGQETTSGLIGLGILRMLNDPQLMETLRAEPQAMESAVEEFLRMDCPAQITARTLLKDVEVDGHALSAGCSMHLVLAAANRDPAVFAEPDRFDVHRHPNRHLAFGSGIHFCVGAYLTRLQARAAFSAVLRRLPGMRLTRFTRRENVTFRGLDALHVAVPAP